MGRPDRGTHATAPVLEIASTAAILQNRSVTRNPRTICRVSGFVQSPADFTAALAGEMSPLRRRMIEDMTVRNLSQATQRCYVHAVSKLSRHFGRSPDRLGLAEVRAFPGASGGERDFLAGAEPDGLCAAVLLRRDAGPGMRDLEAEREGDEGNRAAKEAEAKLGLALSDISS